MGLFTLHNFCVFMVIELFKAKLDSQSRPTSPELSGYPCIFGRLQISMFRYIKIAHPVNSE